MHHTLRRRRRPAGRSCMHAVQPLLPLLLLLLTSCLLVQRAAAFCPSKCRCDADNSLRIECPNAALDVVPIQLNPDVKFINLTLNHIQNVHFTLQFYNNLEVLDLSDNHINTLGSRNFESQEKLNTLILSGNLIGHLHKDVFRGLRRLQTLVLSHNRIAVVHAAAMLDLVNLRSLVMANNSVVSLENGTLRNCQSLASVDMRQNELLDVPGENLRHAQYTLRSLDVAQNFIQTLANGSFEGLGVLQRLDVSGNVLNEIEAYALAPLVKLTHLNLADNNITNIPSNQLSHLSQLTYLSLSGNNIISLPALAFVNLFQLKELHVNRMELLAEIDARAFVDNTLLQTLSMDENPGITAVPHHLYRNNPKLSELRMRGNSLHRLDAAHLPPLGQLGRLYLADNPFVCNCSLLWLWQLTQNAAAAAPPTATATASLTHHQPADDTSNYQPRHSPNQLHGRPVLVDRANVSCYFWSENTRLRRVTLAALSASDIQCPTYYAYAVACTLLVVLAAVAAGGWLVRWRWRRRTHQRCARERKHIMDQPVPPLQVQHHQLQMQLHHQQQQQQQQLEAKMRYGEYGGELQQPHPQPTYYQQQHQHVQAAGYAGTMPSTVGAPMQFDGDDDDLDDHYEQFDDYRYEQHHRRLDKPAPPTLFQLGLGPAQPASIVYV